MFNATPEWTLEYRRKCVGYARLFVCELLVIALSLLAGALFFKRCDSTYSCGKATQIFGMLFPVIVVVIVLRAADLPLLLRVAGLVMACQMLGFHLMHYYLRDSATAL